MKIAASLQDLINCERKATMLIHSYRSDHTLHTALCKSRHALQCGQRAKDLHKGNLMRLFFLRFLNGKRCECHCVQMENTHSSRHTVVKTMDLTDLHHSLPPLHHVTGTTVP